MTNAVRVVLRYPESLMAHRTPPFVPFLFSVASIVDISSCTLAMWIWTPVFTGVTAVQNISRSHAPAWECIWRVGYLFEMGGVVGVPTGDRGN